MVCSSEGSAYRFQGTLIDRLRAASTGEYAGSRGITFIEGTRDETFLSYKYLYRDAAMRAGQLRAAGIGNRSEVLLPIEENREFVILFWACLLADAIPVPLAGAAHDELNLKLLRIRDVLEKPWLIATDERIRKLEAFMRTQPGAAGFERAVSLETLGQMAPLELPAADPRPEDLAFLQFSSGSTGDPKGVRLTHANLLANIGSTLRGSHASSSDSMLSWMPLSHDMGLIGVHLRSVCALLNQHLMPTSLFVRRPMLWLDLVNKHRATHLVCPNFGYEYLLSSYKEGAAAAWDLSCIRVISNGAEPISEVVARRFCAAMAPHRMSPHVIQACYGLAENTLAVTLSVPGEPLRTWKVARASIAVGRPVELSDADNDALTLVDCGTIVDTTEVRIAAEDGDGLPDLHVGRILIAGASTSSGYYNNPEATSQTVREGWLDTGDLGFRHGNRLVVTGRAKELIILNGANIYPYDIERIVEKALGLESGSVAACGCRSPNSISEELVLFVRHKGPAKSFAEVAERARREVAGRMGLVVSDLIPIRRIPKTTSGKLQRYRLAQAYEKGEFVTESPRPSLPEADALRTVTELALGLTNAPGLDPDRALAEQGFDSLRAVELAKRLGDRLGLQLQPSLVFDYPSLRAIAAHIETLRGTAPAPAIPAQQMPSSPAEPVAILGAGLRLPGGIQNLDDFWRVLRDAVDCVSEVPATRWAANPDARFGAFVDNVDAFDARFFEISGTEATELDPQQRLLLETSWEAMEQAGQNAAAWRGKPVGVFVGLSNTDYSRRHVHSGDARRIGPYALTGSSPSAAAGRISYCFGFEGPSMAVDTACSSSLVAVHLAARSLQSGESSLALAAGVNLILGPEVHIGFSHMGAMAADGRSKAFDSSADGYVRGEGCVVVVMKRLSDALADGDPILAVLRGSAVNQDGASNGFTAPNGLAQRAVLAAALANAGVEAASVGYVEAHGTGTPLGDPQEMAAIADVYRPDRASPPLLVGSVKTNIGHTEAAAGLSGLLKAVLCVREGAVPASLHFRSPSPAIPWNDVAVRVPATLERWPESAQPRRAAVSSFGFSGTNSHAIVEACPPRERHAAAGSPALLLPISAKSPQALAALRDRWIEFLSREHTDAAAACSTAALRRASHRWRLAVAGATRERLRDALRTAELPAEPTSSDTPKVVFVFPGQGSQWRGMGREMMQVSEVFRASIQECVKAFEPYFNWDPANDPLTDIDHIQPALFAFEVALARVWQSFGIEPYAVIGHSMGETAAAFVAGALSLADAARIICRRSSLLRQLSGKGAMCSADLPLLEATKLIAGSDGSISVAACNAPDATVLSGDPGTIDRIVAHLEAQGVFARRIKVDVASHSPQVDVLRPVMETELAGIVPRPQHIAICSTVTGGWIGGAALGAGYWIDNLRQPVLFNQGIETLVGDGATIFIELTPHPILVPFIETRATAIGSLRRDEPEMPELYSALAKAWQSGLPIDWKRVFSQPYSPVELPGYPWQRERYWIDEAASVSSTPFYPDLGSNIEVAGERTVLRECLVDLREASWLADHKVEGAVVFPAAAMVELAARATGAAELIDVQFTQPLILKESESRRLQIHVSDNSFSILTREIDGGEWLRHCSGRTGPLRKQNPVVLKAPPTGGKESLYSQLRMSGLEYGPAFQLIECVRASNGIVEALIAKGRPATFLDSCFQTLGALDPGLWIPAGVESVWIGSEPVDRAIVRSELTPAGAAHITVVDEKTGARLATIAGLRLERLDHRSVTGPAVYAMEWRPVKSLPETGGERRVWLHGHGVAPEGGATDVVYVAPAPTMRALEDFDFSEVVGEVTRLLTFVKSLPAADGNPPRLRLLTRDAEGDPVQSALRGFFRSVVREYPEFRPVAIDLSPDPNPRELELAMADWPDTEPEIFIRGESAFVIRVAPAGVVAGDSPAKPDQAFCANIDKPGDLERLSYAPMTRRPPQRGEVEIEVAASGLNFLNVLSAMGLYPGCPGGFRSLGIECAGRVARCGEGVTEFQPGDPVFGMAEHTLASHAIARAALVARNPGIAPPIAAGLPVAYLTAAWCLRHLARLEAGESVLIHSGTGGVGRAAIEIARRAGARIFATAGSPARRAALAELGVEGVYDSRTRDFERKVREATHGRGVDVVLSALAGDGMEASLRCLAPLGRFVEIGKRDLYGGGRIGLENFRTGISYFAVDLDRLAREREPLLGALWRDLAGELERGELPPPPVTDYPFTAIDKAFADMAQSKQSGKIVLSRSGGPVRLRRRSGTPYIDTEKTWLITGGTGAVGLLVAHWLEGQGVRNIVLTARSEPGPEADALNARFIACDVSDPGSVNRLLSGIERSMPPLGGIVHAAGVLADSSIANMEPDAIRQVFAAKVDGALNLHTLTLDAPLDHFVMISSAAGVLGPAGQANYAAANAFLGALAKVRRDRQLPAVAVALGPVAGRGMAAGATSTEGLRALSPDGVGALIFEAAGTDLAHPLTIDLSCYQSPEAVFAEVVRRPADAAPRDDTRSRILAIPSHAERIRALEDLLIMQAARLLRCDPASIDPEAPFKTLGLDSLMAMQLRNRLNDEFGVRLATTTFWNHPSPRQYALFLLNLLDLGSPLDAAAAPHAAVEDLSETEAERLLMEKLQ